MINDIDNSNDYELIMLYREDDEQAKNILYLKYKFIINLLIKKYSKYLIKVNADYDEVYSECTIGFSDALKRFNEEKDASLPTFITLCVERKLKTVIKKYNRNKYKISNEALSLDYIYDDDQSLMDYVVDLEHEPLKNMEDNESYIDLVKSIKEELTKKEYDVFLLMARNLSYVEIANILGLTPKQVDNTIAVSTRRTRITVFWGPTRQRFDGKRPISLPCRHRNRP